MKRYDFCRIVGVEQDGAFVDSALYVQGAVDGATFDLPQGGVLVRTKAGTTQGRDFLVTNNTKSRIG